MLSIDEKKIIYAAHEAGKIISSGFGKAMKTYRKTTSGDFYTKVDIEAEEKILDILNNNFSNYNILAEESGSAKNGSDFTFVIDPLDGTNNFALGIPYFSVAIALMKKKEVVFSCIYNPVLDETFYAQKGKGTYRNDKKVTVNNKKYVDSSVVSLVAGYSTMVETRNKFGQRLYDNNISRILDNWCPTLDYTALASGKIECVLNNDDDQHEAIIGKLIISEAGGSIIDFNGSKDVSVDENKFIATNTLSLSKKIFNIIK